MNENSSIRELKGIGEKTEKLFAKVGVYTIGDMIRYFPRVYDVFEEPIHINEIEEGKICAISGCIEGRIQVGGGKYTQITAITLSDETGKIKVIWYKMPYLKNTLKPGMNMVLRGKVISKKGQLTMEHPEIYSNMEAYMEKVDTLQPVYPLTTGLTNNLVIKTMKQALDCLDLKQDFLPGSIRMEYQLAEYNFAMKGIHFPTDKEAFYHARERLVFEEFLLFLLTLQRLKEKSERAENAFHIEKKAEIEQFLKHLPFKLTRAQMNVWEQIQKDMCSEFVMSRLIQGDVGSGKTIVAVLALMLTGLNGYQGAIMAPTEVLAKQHYESFQSMFEENDIPLKIELLTGSMTAKEKRAAYARIESGEVQIIIGTHALIQSKVQYNNLALVVTDEQHRFGVRQRESFASKGKCPHILVMSATPIPRTLAIILYGDLDISVINELPANRLPIKNCVVDTSYRATAYQFMKRQIAEGRQCYVICPMVEESEAIEAENVMEYARKLQEEMGSSIVVCALHGKMKQAQKDEIMNQFSNNEIHILVSTTVIEVGINVPNATVMMVENAERFGLAQLHQLRGRVGRGKWQSYCIFMSASKTKDTKKRLEILNKSNDGFYIASEDLKLRGPGDLFGIRQSGLLDFKIADVYQDADILQYASEASKSIICNNPLLEGEEYERLRKKVEYALVESNVEMTL